MSIIRVDNLGKRYTIGHDRRAGGMFRYHSLRDTLAHQARALWQRARHPLSPNRENTDLEEFWALRDLAFEIQPGERVGIIGRNGAGKSTLLKLLSRITEPTTGRIELNGRIASLLEVGTGFHPELTGRENIYLNGAILGMTRAEIKAKFDQIVDFAEVEKFLDTPVKRYSSGMYVRLAFAVAAHLEPEILLVDEVLAVGDAAFQKKCLGKMEDIATNEGRTVLFVSHNMAAIQNLCPKAILLVAGKVARIDASETVIDQYLKVNFSQAPDGSLRSIHREGDGKVRIVGWSLKSSNGTPVAILKSGTEATISFDYEATEEAIGSEMSLAVGIDTATGFRLCHLSTATVGQPPIIRCRGTVQFHLERVPLTTGIYHCTVFCMINETVADWLINAFSFEVHAGDFYGTGRTPPLGQGNIMLSYRVDSEAEEKHDR